MPRFLRLEPAAVGAGTAALYFVIVLVYRVATGDLAADPDLIVAAATTAWGMWTRRQVTPLERPRDADGDRLTPYGT